MIRIILGFNQVIFAAVSVVGAGDGAALVAHDDASEVVVIRGMNANMVEVAVRDAAVVDEAHESADVLIALDIGIVEDDVLHRAVAADVAEEAEAAGIVACTRLLDSDAADGVSLAVVGAVEALAVTANGREVVVNVVYFVPHRGAAVSDIGGLAEGHVRAVVASVSGFAVPSPVSAKVNVITALPSVLL